MYPGGQYIHCCGCYIDGDANFTKRSLALEHLKLHLERGHFVPQRAINRLEKEIKEVGDEY